jgi:hypothetical protein
MEGLLLKTLRNGILYTRWAVVVGIYDVDGSVSLRGVMTINRVRLTVLFIQACQEIESTMSQINIK